jgi:hypothetical protein
LRIYTLKVHRTKQKPVDFGDIVLGVLDQGGIILGVEQLPQFRAGDRRLAPCSKGNKKEDDKGAKNQLSAYTHWGSTCSDKRGLGRHMLRHSYILLGNHGLGMFGTKGTITNTLLLANTLQTRSNSTSSAARHISLFGNRAMIL